MYQLLKCSPAHAHEVLHSTASFLHLWFFIQPFLHLHDTSLLQAFEASGKVVQLAT